MKIYIIRHGQTEWNRLGRWQGQTDIPLNAAGVAQAEKAAEKLQGLSISRIYASPLSRAAETAKIVQQKIAADIIYHDALKEIKLGEWEGLTVNEVKAQYAEAFDRWNEDEEAEIEFGVENYQALQARAFAVLNEILTREVGRAQDFEEICKSNREADSKAKREANHDANREINRETNQEANHEADSKADCKADFKTASEGHREGDALLIVTHGAWFRALLCKILHIPLKHRLSFETGNAAINGLDYDPVRQTFRVFVLNA